MSARTACGDARVLDLDRDVAAVVQPRAVDLADRGGGDRLGARTPRRSPPAARRARTRSPCACRRSAPSARRRAAAPSLRWNSSRCSSGTSPTSRKLITCPSFIAAPFIVPSAATICSAASRWRRSSAASRALLGAGEVRRAGAEVARRLARGEAGDLRGAGDPRGRDPVLGHPAGSQASGAGTGVGAARGRRRRRRRRGGGGRRRRWRVGARASAVAVGVGGRRRAVLAASRSPSASASPSSSACSARCRRTGSCGGRWPTEPPNSASSDAVTTPAAITNGQQAGDRARSSAAGSGAAPAQAERVVVAHGRTRRRAVLGSGSKRSGPSPRAPTPRVARAAAAGSSGARRRPCRCGA